MEDGRSLNVVDMLAQFRPLWYKFDYNAHLGSRSEGLNTSCWSDSGLIQLEKKTSLPLGSAILCDSSNSCKPNWRDNFSIVRGSAHGSNSRCLAHAPGQWGKWDRRAMPCQVDTFHWGCSSHNGRDRVESEMV